MERALHVRSSALQLAQMHQRQVRILIKQHCCSNGVQVVLFPLYYGFGLELDRYARQWVGGPALRAIARTLVARWQARGLDPEILWGIVCLLTNIRPEGMKLEARNPNTESSPNTGKDKGQSTKDEAEGKGERTK